MLNPSASLGVVIFGNVWAARVQADRAAAAMNTKGCMGRDFMSESLYRMRPGPLRGAARLLRSPCFFPLTPTLSRCSLRYLAHVCSRRGNGNPRKGEVAPISSQRKSGGVDVPAGPRNKGEFSTQREEKSINRVCSMRA